MPHEQSEGEAQGKGDEVDGEQQQQQQQQGQQGQQQQGQQQLGVKSAMLRSVSVPCDLASLPAEQQARLHWQMHRQHNRSAIQDLFCGERNAFARQATGAEQGRRKRRHEAQVFCSNTTPTACICLRPLHPVECVVVGSVSWHM